MYTQCPHCQTCFRIAEAHLKAAKGRVRCGSCQEVFDASGHLYTKLPAIPENKVAPADDLVITPDDLRRIDHDHIDLSATPINGSVSIPTEQPDQSAFMESTVGNNSLYNDLDAMGPISLPGELNFGDSYIKEAEEKQREIDAVRAAANPYEDLESKESPASADDANGIQDLYTAADELMHTSDDKTEDTEKAELDKRIDKLMSFADGLDLDSELTHAANKTSLGDEYDDPDDIDELQSVLHKYAHPAETGEIDVLLAGLDDKQDGVFVPASTAEPADEQPAKQRDSSIEFDASKLAIEPTTSGMSAIHEQSLGIRDPERLMAFNHEPANNPEPDPANNLGDFEGEMEDSDLGFGPDAATNDLDDLDDLLEADRENSSADFEDDLTDFEAGPENTGQGFTGDESVDDLLDLLESHQKSDVKEALDSEQPSVAKDIPLALRRSLENMAPPARRSPVMTIGLLMAVLVLLAGLAAQFILFRSTELVRMMPSLSPVLSDLCNTIPCRYTGPRDVTQISLSNRDVRSHPTHKNALLISAAFVNQANFEQPYPTILVTLSDLGGNIVANRRFTPQEYLDTLYNRFLLMESGTPVHITLPVLDPGSDAINFEFTFLP